MSLSANLGWGIRWGLAFASGYIAWVLLLYLVAGSAPFEEHGNLTVGKAIVAYIAGGVLAGSIVGSLRPLVRWLLGAIVLGVIAAVPVTLGMLIAMVGMPPWAFEYKFAAVIAPIVLGSLGGLIMREIFYEEK